MKSNKKFYLKWISSLIKTVIVATAVIFIYREVFHENNIVNIVDALKQYALSKSNIASGTFVLILVLVNWGIEAFKWRFIIKKLEKISLLNSFKAVLAGICVSIFTPNRTGEFGGRVFILEKADRVKASVVTIMGSISQFLVTIITGAAGLLFFIPNYMSESGFYSQYLFYSVCFLFLLLISLLIFCFINTSFLSSLLNRLNPSPKIKEYFDVFSYYSPAELLKVLLFSIARSIVFTMQFYLILSIMGVSVPFMQAVLMITMTFFIMTIIPTVALTEMGVRSSAAIYFIGMLSENNAGILASSFVLWIVNLALPALAGSIIVFSLKFFRQ